MGATVLSKDLGARVGRVQCMSNMRSLHVSFESFVQDHGIWPPGPSFDDEDMVKTEDWWFQQMDPYTGSRKVWLCPVLQNGRLKAPGSDTPVQMHYMPTQFDGAKMAPYRWPKQPWLVEIANAHGQGALVLLPDGSIKSTRQMINGK